MTKITFDQPVQIPGFVLEAGTYWFQLAAPEHNATVVQVLNENRVHVASVVTKHVMRLSPEMTDVAIAVAEPARGPAALKTWFYPAATVGHEFVYEYEEDREFREK